LSKATSLIDDNLITTPGDYAVRINDIRYLPDELCLDDVLLDIWDDHDDFLLDGWVVQ